MNRLLFSWPPQCPMGLVVLAVLAVPTPSRAADAPAKVTFVDQVLPVVEQHCAKCHNPDKKKGDLDLTSHAGALKGGGSGAVVVSGNPESSKLIKALTHAEEPFMPPNKPPIAEAEIAVFRNWITGGLLETSGSKAVAASKPKVDLALKVSSADRPDGPPPMPRELPIDPVVHTTRPGAISGLAASPWAPVVAVTGQKQLLLFNTTNLDLIGVLPFTEGQPFDVKFSRSGKIVLAGGGHGAKSGRVLLWDVESGRSLATVGNEYDSVLAADLSPDQGKVALGGPDRLIKIHATATGELLHKIKKHTDWVTALAFSPDGRMLASGDRNGGVTIWDADDAEELFTTPGHKTGVTSLSWRVDSKLVASSSEDGTVKLWETTEGKQAKTWNAHSGGVLSVAYSRDGRFASCGRDGAVIVWDANGNKVKSMSLPGEMAVRCAWTHDDAAVVAADFAGNLGVWDAKSGKLLGTPDANPRPLRERIAAAQQRVTEIEARRSHPTAAAAASEKELAERTTAVEAARTAAETASADFRAKADVVAKLKETSTRADPPADLDAQLTAARATRESARAVNVAASAALDTAKQQLTAAQAKAQTASKDDTAEELAAARSALARLQQALERTNRAAEKQKERNPSKPASAPAAPAAAAAPSGDVSRR